MALGTSLTLWGLATGRGPALRFAVWSAGPALAIADIEGEQSLNISLRSIEACITPRTRAILVVHYGGYACDMPGILSFAQKHGLAVIEDAAALAADVPYLTNETVFSLTALPPRLAVIGGGPIGCELAQAFARFGSRVSLIESGPHLLGREDADAAALIETVLRREGIELYLEAKILEVVTAGEEKIIRLQRGDGGGEIRVDAILVGAGRTPNIEGLDLERGGIIYDRSGIKVNDRLQTSNPLVYAAGDICSPYKFTHTADAQARILIANALFMGRQKASALVVPWCTYTDPEIAHVGLYERDAERQGIKITTLTVPLATIDRAVIDGDTEGFARIHLRRGSDQILGATIVARHGGEMISELSLAMTGGLGLAAVGRTIHPYPTQAEAIRKLADAWNRTRLTPTVKRLLGGWLQWRRR